MPLESHARNAGTGRRLATRSDFDFPIPMRLRRGTTESLDWKSLD